MGAGAGSRRSSAVKQTVHTALDANKKYTSPKSRNGTPASSLHVFFFRGRGERNLLQLFLIVFPLGVIDGGGGCE